MTKLTQKEVVELMNDEVYSLIVILLVKGYSVSLNKVKIIKYIIDNPDQSISKIGKDLNIDYKNTYRIIQELKDIGVLQKDEVSQGKTSKVKLK